MKKIFFLLIGIVLTAMAAIILFFFARQAWAAAQAERAWQAAQVEPVEDFGATSHLEILPLYEEAGDPQRFQTGHGLSYLIRTDSATFLMDVGNNPNELEKMPLATNMDALAVRWDEIDAVVFSHFHPDHVGGVAAWQAGQIAVDVEAEMVRGKPVYTPSEFVFPGASITLLPAPQVLASGVATIGTIEYGETYPVSLYTASGAEQVLAVNVTGKGIVLIMGCGHPTVERIIARAEALFDQPVVGIVGGLHYEGKTAADVQPQIEFLQARSLQLVAPSPHDSSPEALQAFQNAFVEAYRQVQVGQAITFSQ